MNRQAPEESASADIRKDADYRIASQFCGEREMLLRQPRTLAAHAIMGKPSLLDRVREASK